MGITFDVAGTHLYILPVGDELHIWIFTHIEETLDLCDQKSPDYREPDLTLSGSERDLIFHHLGSHKQKALELGIPLTACYLGLYEGHVRWRISA